MTTQESLAKAVAEGRAGERLWLYATYHCNLACSYCLTESHPRIVDRRTLSRETMLEAVAEAKELGFTCVGITGGEVFMLADFAETLRRTTEMLPTVALTNATHVTERLLRELEPLAGLDAALQISLDSDRPERNDALRGPQNFAKVVHAIPIANGVGAAENRIHALFVLIRVLLGVFFISVWVANLGKGLYGADGYAELIRGYADDGSTIGLWKELMRLVADGAVVASKLQAATELAFGILLIGGLLTRITGIAAGLFLTSLFISELGVPDLWFWELPFIALTAFSIAAVSAGRRLGLDAYLLDRPPLSRLPRWARG